MPCVDPSPRAPRATRSFRPRGPPPHPTRSGGRPMRFHHLVFGTLLIAAITVVATAEDPPPAPPAKDPAAPRPPSSFQPVADTTPFEEVVRKMQAAKDGVQRKHAT